MLAPVSRAWLMARFAEIILEDYGVTATELKCKRSQCRTNKHSQSDSNVFHRFEVSTLG
jgi:hypothetical protein